MKHLGDITKISGYDVEPVDCICGGSPCQDLSVAGRRKGLAGERSGLYMEQIRIIKEMRAADVQRGRSGQSKPRSDPLPELKWWGISATLDASYYKGTGSRNGKEREYIGVPESHRSHNGE